jgi:hypothetical protein
MLGFAVQDGVRFEVIGPTVRLRNRILTMEEARRDF